MTKSSDQAAAELRGLMRFATGLGLDEAIVLEFYSAVCREDEAYGVDNDEAMAEVRKRMLAAAREG